MKLLFFHNKDQKHTDKIYNSKNSKPKTRSKLCEKCFKETGEPELNYKQIYKDLFQSLSQICVIICVFQNQKCQTFKLNSGWKPY